MELEKIIPNNPTPIEKIQFQGVELSILRLDMIHPFVSGNKFYKLKYNLEQAKNEDQQSILTFGGAFSNHIAATAFAAKAYGLKSIGIIRGEEIENSTLNFARENGMKLIFIDRASYRKKNTNEFIAQLKVDRGNFYLIPEGGTNKLALKGTAEIMDKVPDGYKKIACCLGTGGTMAGLINASLPDQEIIGFSSLKGQWIIDEIQQRTSKNNWSVYLDYHFGGYAKWKPQLIEFINHFFQETNIPLDPIYTGKMVYGVLDLIKKGQLDSEKLLLIHSGGLQGIEGFNARFGNIIET